jgi:glycosyltransferase involved in cell wall biosynthesis
MPRRKLRTIYNPVVDDTFEARSRVPVAHPWFRQPGEPVFVTAGRLVAQKDHETLLRALALHRQRIPGRLLILGEGPMRDRLGALAAELGVDDAVDFLGFQANPLPMFRNADAFILSSRAEGFGNVLVEAMACGTPVISTDCRYGPAEILAGGRFGTLVPPHDPVSLAVAMDGVAALRARCPADMLRARAAEFTLAACADRYRTLFEDLVHGQRVTA